MVQARLAEPGLQIARQPLVGSEDDSGDQRRALAGQPGRDAARHEGAETIAEGSDPASPANLAPAASVQHDVDPLAREPGPFVEALFGWTRRLDLCHRLDHCTLRRGSAERKLQEGRLAGAVVAEVQDLDHHAQLELAVAGRGRDLGHRPVDMADPRHQKAPVERVQPKPSPDPTGSGQNDRERGDTGRSLECCRPERCRDDDADERETPAGARDSLPRARRTEPPREHAAALAAASRSRRHQIAELLEARGSDSGDRVEVVDRRESAVRLAPVQDLLSRDGPDSRERIQLFE